MTADEIVGRRFGALTVTEDSGERKGSSILWRCRCDCGGETLATRRQLVSGRIVSCGCVPRPERPRVTDLIGQRFGLLTVMEDSGRRTGEGTILWRCRCDCGGEVLAVRRELVSGSAASCGCAAKNRAEDLTGKRFGGLTVLRRAGNGRWRCRCSCGKELEVPAGQLKSGKTQSCGCGRHGAAVNRYDLTGQRFGRLTALYPVRKEGRVRNSYWHCKCDCGNELDVYTGSLLRGRTQSCGCWNREQSGKMHGHMHYRDETCVEILRSSCEETGRNKAGFRGLFLLKNGKYRASITFQGKHYDLGHYASFDRAVQARLEAEEVLHRGYLRAFERYGEKAKADRDWAESNPFFYQVRRVNGEFLVSTNGE